MSQLISSAHAVRVLVPDDRSLATIYSLLLAVLLTGAKELKNCNWLNNACRASNKEKGQPTCPLWRRVKSIVGLIKFIPVDLITAEALSRQKSPAVLA
jgi:hypothetical protein